MSAHDTIEITVRHTRVWLQRVADAIGTDDPPAAFRVLGAVLHALRDRLGVEVSAHVSAQLPMLVRGLFYEGWDPTGTPTRLSLDEFLERVEHDARLKGRSAAEDAVRAVFAVLWDELGEGTVGHVTAVLPEEYAVLY